jgi:signal transduction histidine kinase
MGLAIVKKIAESNGGSVRVESIPGAGATFIVSLRAGDRP